MTRANPVGPEYAIPRSLIMLGWERLVSNSFSRAKSLSKWSRKESESVVRYDSVQSTTINSATAGSVPDSIGIFLSVFIRIE